MNEPNDSNTLEFPCRQDLDEWLRENHNKSRELWIKMYKKSSGIKSVDWKECVVKCLTWGWIDGKCKSVDDVSFVQRITPRRPKSNWSKRNCLIAQKLIDDGLMQPAGMAEVLRARADGRWDKNQ
eukprot:Partr_v1_DN25592_c1_g1_i1_m20716 putative NA